MSIPSRIFLILCLFASLTIFPISSEQGSDGPTATQSGLGGPAFPVTLSSGWNLFSTPVTLDGAHSSFGAVFVPDDQPNIVVVLGWNGAQWYIPTASTEIRPLDAYYIRVANGTTATAMVVPSSYLTIPPSRKVNAGANLIGPALPYDANLSGFSAMPLNDALITIRDVGDLPGYVTVISPGLNQPGWVYERGGKIEDLLPFRGYWVIMENGPDTLFGFSMTPIS